MDSFSVDSLRFAEIFFAIKRLRGRGVGKRDRAVLLGACAKSFTVMPRCGHPMMLEEPDVFGRVVAQLLD
jgi:hypothetical protein